MSTSPEDAPSGTSDPAVEPLACVSCRSRKLKCDRHKPACARCTKVSSECVYPESRRKPAFKRRNVKELEERLAQVEGFLKKAGKPAAATPFGGNNETPDDLPATANAPGSGVELELNDMYFTNTSGSPQDKEPPRAFSWKWDDHTGSSSSGSPEGSSDAQAGGELFRLGRFEGLPPFDMIEALHSIFFGTQQSFIPLINRARYLQAFYSTAPHVRPPMALQYAIWAMAANGNEKYSRYYDIFYRRARQYLDNDELKGYGEHFITLAHAQAWALIGTSEARSMHFTKASMSAARCVRLVEMMGFHRLDDPSKDENPIAPTVDPPKDWIDLEERRRVFWGAFCMDSHVSISTGWPTLVDLSLVTTHLPCSEEAFESGTEEKMSTLGAVFGGAQYSTFAATVVTCHIFTRLLKHVHRPLPDDSPGDYERGKYWKRHRELDNMLSSSFMFLPERFRLPKYHRDPVAIYQNLNLHASVICLHTSACDKVDKYKLSGHIKQASRMRCLTAAYEIVNIMKLTMHITTRYKTPLVALSLYTAASVFLSQAKEEPEKADVDSLSFLVSCMDAIGRQHVITRAYLNHLMLDIRYNGIDTGTTLLSKMEIHSACGYNIPLLARSSASFNTQVQPPLPLSRPPPSCPYQSTYAGRAPGPGIAKVVDLTDTEAPGSKRKRTSGPLGGSAGSEGPLFYPEAVPRQQNISTSQVAPQQAKNDRVGDVSARFWASIFSTSGSASSSAKPVQLPHRSNTPSITTASSKPGGQDRIDGIPLTASPDLLFYQSLSQGDHLSTTTAVAQDSQPGVVNTTNTDMMADMPNNFEGLDDWDGILDSEMFSQMAAAMLVNTEGNTANNVATGSSQEGDDPWTQILGATDGWDAAATAVKTGGV